MQVRQVFWEYRVTDWSFPAGHCYQSDTIIPAEENGTRGSADSCMKIDLLSDILAKVIWKEFSHSSFYNLANCSFLKLTHRCMLNRLHFNIHSTHLRDTNELVGVI